MSHSSQTLLVRAVHWWERNFLQHPWLVILLFLVVSGFTLRYVMDNLKVNTNTADMISLEVPFQKNRLRLESAFPQDVSAIVLLIEGKTPEQTAAATQRIGAELRKNTIDFKSVYLPDEGEFFARNGLLYLDLPELEDLSAQLANAQPFIGHLAGDTSLNGLFDILGMAVKESGKEDQGINLDPMLEKLGKTLNAVAAGKPIRLSWQQLMMTRKEGIGITKRFITITPHLHFEELLPAEKAINAVNGVVAGVLQGDLAEVKALKTGEVIMEYEEMATLGETMAWAGVASLILVCLTLWIAYRSFKLVFATFVSLNMGLILSLGFATVSIGHLNVISIGFAVLFIGMGDAYSSHFCLRYRELLLRGRSQTEALRNTLISTGSALVLSAITGAIGLYSYIPTHYSGVGELGIIAGTSMFIALGTTFTVLPALMKIMPIHPSRPPQATRGNQRSRSARLLSNWPLRHARKLRWLTALLTIGSVWLLGDLTVDFNPINLRDPNTDSVKTYKYLLKSRDTSPMTVASLATTPEEVRAKTAKFQTLPSVDKVVSVFDFIPAEQEEKLAVISDLALIMGPQLENFPAPKFGVTTPESLAKFHEQVRARLAKRGEIGLAGLAGLEQKLTEFRARLDAIDPEGQRQLLDRLETSLLGYLPATIDDLRESLGAQPITLESLPPDVSERWLSKSGVYRVQIYPKEDLNDLVKLRAFIRATQQIDPNVTDVPVTYLESMDEVVTAFQQAFAIAFIATALLLLILLRNLKDTLLVLLPLLLASLFTAAITVLIGLPFNFANIIALPLLFGLGVDSGIHMAHRLHYLHAGEENLLGTSEAQGVFFGALTTIFSFSSLAFTPHQGTASMGLLLAVGLMMTLVCALIVLPAFSTLHIRYRH